MIFLIAKIFIYLLFAGFVGGAAGWLLRNLQAQRTEESASRAVHDAKSKVPQLESLLRGRDEQIIKLKDQLQEGKAHLSEMDQELRTNEQKLREAEREVGRWQQSAEAAKLARDEDYDISTDDGDATNNLIAELSQEIARLKTQLEESPDPVSIAQTGDELGLQVELETMQAKLAKTERDLAGVRSDFLHEQNKVTELECERELQNKSLHVLHQQLDLERTRRVSNG